MRPVDPGTGVVVALHGFGDDPAAARTWGRTVAPSGWEVVAPGAPATSGGPRSWFSTGPRGVDAGELRAAAGRVGDLVDRVRVSGRRVVVVGFSQGGALALALSSFGVEPDATVALCGFMPESDLIAPTGPTEDTGPVLVLNTEDDEDVPEFMGRDAAALLAASGRTVTAELLPGAHAVDATMAARVRSWIGGDRVPGPRVSLSLPVDRVASGSELVSGEAVAELARLYEALGFHAAYVTDHPAPDDRWLQGGGHHAMEPTVALSAAAMVTTRLRLHTNVYVLPYRNPFLAAKALASVDVISGGRLIAGVAAGYLRPEFAALGADFDGRGARLDDALEVLPRIWSESGLAASGPSWESRGVTALPRPVQRPGPPIWVGGNSGAALRRAIRSAQGWSPFPTPPEAAKALRTTAIVDIDALATRLARVRELCEEHGRRDPLTICFVPFGLAAYLEDPVGMLAPLVDEIAALAELGVDWVALMVPGATRSEVSTRAAELAAALALD